jgi:hypothetical protein
MATPKSPSLDLPPELIHQYKDAWSKVSADLRLVVLLVFNAFEEVMKAVLAWRLTCSVDELPSRLTSGSLLGLVLTNSKDAKELRKQSELLSRLRNDVAHGFHKRAYKIKLAEFVKAVTGKPCPQRQQKQAFIDAVTSLALAIAVHVSDHVDERGEFPVPMLSLELGDLARKKRAK